MAAFLDEFQHLKIQLEKIKSATNNFDDSKVIGAGGFGKVYKGELSHFKGRSMVAIKRLDRKYGQGDPEFWKEIMMLSRYTHENLISLLGFCDEGGERILVYEHAPNGSLDRHISATSLTWTRRLKICLDAARGLNYLHDDKGTQQRILHRDIKSSNILLDENWNAKVSDMGLSKIGPANQQHTALVTNVVGTLGYLDPMYLELGILTKESDVYSFGIVLFEVLCGRLCFENSNGRFPSLVRLWKQSCKEKKLDEIIFQDLVQQMDLRSLETFSDIAFQCLQKSRELRPKMSLVVEKLKIALEFQEIYEEMKHPTDYEKMIKTAVHPITYKSEDELKTRLSKGILLNGGKTWLSFNKNGEHCEMISAAECLIKTAKTSSFDEYVSEKISRFAARNCYRTHNGIFKARVRTQFLSPRITYTVNLVFKSPGKVHALTKPSYIGIKYRLEGETKSSTACLADVREDGWLMAELYQFTSERKNVDLDILFDGSENYTSYWLIEGIEFLPIEKVKHKVLEDGKVDMQQITDSDTDWEQKLPSDYEEIIKLAKDSFQRTTKQELYFLLCKGFLINNGEEWLSLAKNGKRCHMLPAKAVLLKEQWKWKSQTESRFEEVAFDPVQPFSIICKINSQILSPETAYASYLVYKLPENISEFEFPLKVKDKNFHQKNDWEVFSNFHFNYDLPLQYWLTQFISNLPIPCWLKGMLIWLHRGGGVYPFFSNFRFIYLLTPQTPVIRPKDDQNANNPLNKPRLFRFSSLLNPQTPTIRQNDDQNTYNPLNRPRLKGIPQQRSDGWMEVQVCVFRTRTAVETSLMRVDLGSFFSRSLKGLTVHGIEFRPI